MISDIRETSLSRLVGASSLRRSSSVSGHVPGLVSRRRDVASFRGMRDRCAPSFIYSVFFGAESAFPSHRPAYPGTRLAVMVKSNTTGNIAYLGEVGEGTQLAEDAGRCSPCKDSIGKSDTKEDARGPSF